MTNKLDTITFYTSDKYNNLYMGWKYLRNAQNEIKGWLQSGHTITVNFRRLGLGKETFHGESGLELLSKRFRELSASL